MTSFIDALKQYQPSSEAAELVAKVPTLLLVGISGAGKDTVKHRLLEMSDYHHIVSHTTRPMRKNHGVMEKNGVDYHYIDMQTAETMIKNQGFIEVKQYSRNIYGTSVAEFQMAHDEGKIAVTDLEVQGVGEYMDIAPGSVRPVFLLPPSYEVWQQRLMQRYGGDHKDHSDDIALRMQTAKTELEHLLATDYFFVVLNDDLEQTIQKVDAIAKSGKQESTEREAALAVVDDILSQLQP